MHHLKQFTCNTITIILKWKIDKLLLNHQNHANINELANIRYYHSNDSHQCPILAADFVIFYYGTENEEAIQAGAGSE